MIRHGLFEAAHLGDLKQALAVYANRHRVVSDNIANVESAGYAAREYRFEEYLAGARLRLQGARTNPAHLALGRRELADTPGDVRPTGDDHDNGINNVDIDKEMTDLATNDLSYRLATRLLSMKYQTLRSAIRGRST
ncbi:MAG TPA: flagellar basal body rod protein FlgB [Candidatus Krumholzibacteria bacterium]|nr:flagellar basal body rod protein FlgB [Candidatus Krumholzibacteria bacterium]HPD71633.1 flagellar basal body rod protein FlgB [Candidatus Krumholzibacteria bacterium]HRY41434.1 flagellar basal body rod protein FlgB [Candidatus Krumholzibacteria bacterium]